MTTRSDYVLAELRCALLRAKLWEADIESIGKALAAGWISPEQAVEALAERIAEKLAECALNGEPWAISQVADRIGGRVALCLHVAAVCPGDRVTTAEDSEWLPPLAWCRATR